CSYIGSGLPDTMDTHLQIQHREAAGIPFTFTLGVTTAGVTVSRVNLTSDSPTPATLDRGSRTITVPIGMGVDSYRTNLLDLGSHPVSKLRSRPSITLTLISRSSVQPRLFLLLPSSSLRRG